MSSLAGSKTNYILAVDDLPDNLFLLKLALEQEGHNVVLVEDGKTALEKIEASPPNLVLLDVMMPEMDGYEVTKRIRSNPKYPYIPILLITAHEQSSVVEGLDAGADDFIRKPVQIDELQARVRSLLRLKQSIDQRENFVRCLTHDLRTPLVAADRVLNLMQQGVFGEINSSMGEAITSMIGSNKNLLDMLNTLLAVYAYDIGRKTLSFIPFDLHALLKEIIAELMPLVEDKSLKVNLNTPTQATTKELVGDRLELRRVLTNLIANAIKFTDEGMVEVNVSLIQKSNSNTASNWIKIEIKDTGIGISLEDQATLFEAFHQGNHKRSGSGLGLHLCRQIVQAHEGTITVESQLNQGTVFTVCLPSNNKKKESDR
ncbi:response regulator [Lyngbya aestuarii BL J]|uniref:Circadian input-output histidine kinase CikA n=1 Tax=Lyngbya aestuarii BL J TaxID=1348334 RepID=U7QEK0_9CYAN|nr:hybrid sensor histidine kinase/response regulator [Lyngbya aestuarii]ERT05485.1 response regulator [Lyngbya aestuarii BL J]